MIRRLSLHTRLLILAALTGIAALSFAAFSIGDVLERFVLRGLDRTLDTQIEILADAVGSDGRLDRAKVVELPGFREGSRGWAWRVHSAAGDWSSTGPKLGEERVRPRRGREPGDIRGGRGRDGRGGPMHLRQLTINASSGPIEITAGAPMVLVERPLREAMGPLLLSLGLLAIGLAVATWLQLRYGLRPLRVLREDVARVRAGETAQLPEDQPREIKPLVDEVNALIENNAAGLEHARRHLANLAHGLKTPLATLSLQLTDAAPETRALVEQLDARISHHLRRARSAAPGAGGRARSNIAEVATDLVEALRRIHADRGLSWQADIEPGLSVAVDRQDLDEMLGNLLDNAGRHARGQVRVSARADGPSVSIEVEDDGPGMTTDEADLAVRPGARLDESERGYGFGLAIVQELAELYGGKLELSRATLGGLTARFVLPA